VNTFHILPPTCEVAGSALSVSDSGRFIFGFETMYFPYFVSAILSVPPPIIPELMLFFSALMANKGTFVLSLHSDYINLSKTGFSQDELNCVIQELATPR